ncbi:DNA gyrase inhibitor YacG [Antarcticimicrobium luteum]|uniref:DNA gyrase inhibitor YacG n=1 Tax=Antarcticimicrobium luteum TaxID=2547397 RepID=A0A4R5UQ48_9RHOB|nr:DNA gyrase inhibitor YacG [Antarcticimicrobium luteum]TDK41169.1 DNA gyrase inhibitor YacG [Antarcticimicrobium luteum]
MSCPICKRETDPAYRPFCSGRCADIDLGNWFKGTYSVPANAPEDLDITEEQAEDARRKPH